ncbi:peroxiredoxin [Guyparkeria hydrothermalis]|uniref:peroxiredoxin n=1 Tax=Guyparkeria TaxID=2035712 RepID=UPI0010AD8354|nr:MULTISPECIES: peroxiredoxin [Guyparkeria]MCL7752032.1 peroxiredoxin [Guyparkeria hydrothermalis]TKA89293.1 peroxiredoxin [Guyparkeria sp. SB14A]
MSSKTAATASPDPRPGQKAPDFSGQTTDGDTLTLANLRGQPLVLYFYPRDNTPGCTTEARDFQAALPAFEAAGARVVGVSNDDAASHRKFCDKQGIDFPLIADTDRSVSQAFNVLRMKNMFGKRFEGIERSTFLIDADGVIREAWRKVKVPGHVEAVLEAVKAL